MMMKTMRIMFLVLSVVTTFNSNDVSAADSNNLIEVLLESLIQKVDRLERNTEKQIEDVNTVVSKVEFKVDDLVTETSDATREMAKKVRASRAESIYSAMSDEVRQHSIDVEGISRALENGYHFVGNGGYGPYDDDILKFHLPFSQCVDMCTKKMHDEGKAWNSIVWGDSENRCYCTKGERGHSSRSTSYVHFKL